MDSNSTVVLENNTILIARDDKQHPIEDSAAPIHDQEGKIIGAMIVFHEANRSLETTTKMAHQAQYDPLTGVLNRYAFAERFEQATALARRHRTKMVLLFIDLDGFKDINDALGHSNGDQVLAVLAKRLLSCVRATDLIGRHGGDEFVVLLSDVEEPEQTFLVADKIREAAAGLVLLDGNKVSIQLSIGVSVYPDNGETLQALLPHADAAMYRVKARSKQARSAPDRISRRDH